MQRNLPDNLKSQTFAPSELMPLQSDHLWLLHEGIVKVSAWTQEGNPMTLGYWGKNDIIGQPLILVHPFRTKCLTNVCASSIPINQANCITNLIARHSIQSEEILNILRAEKIYERLCKMLVWLGKKFGSEIEIGLMINLRLTHQDLAEIIGATRVSVTKLINQLEREGFLSRPERNSIVLLNT